MRRSSHLRAACILGLPLLASCDGGVTNPTLQAKRDYEVWLIDQSDSRGKTYGGTLYIHQKAAIESATGVSAGTPATIDLGGEVSALCLASTGANAVRPHMLMFNSTSSHAILAFVASGHVVIFDADGRRPVACLRASAGTNAGRQAHAATPAPDDSYILVANQNGKLLQRINTNYTTNQYSLDTAATLDLTSCTTPSGAACQSAELRPDNAPIVPTITADSRLAYVTLRGGGLFIVDPKSSPMKIRAEYDKTTIAGSGLMGMQIGDKVVVNAGGGFFAYRFSPAEVAATNAPNRPAPTALLTQVSSARDGHGMTATGRGKFVWITDRATDVAEVFEVASGRRSTVSFASSMSPKPAPDIADVSPAGDLLFVALRGPTPLSGGALAIGSTPGLGIMKLSASGESGTLQGLLRISNLDGTVERADAHAVRVRVKPSMSGFRAVVVRLGRMMRSRQLYAQVLPQPPHKPRPSAVVVAYGADNKPQECDHETVARR